MKHRWLVGLWLAWLAAALTLAACAPAEGGERVEESRPAPADLYDGY